MRILKRTYLLAHMATFSLHTRGRGVLAGFRTVIPHEARWQEPRHVPVFLANHELMAAVAVLVVSVWPPNAMSNSGSSSRTSGLRWWNVIEDTFTFVI